MREGSIQANRTSGAAWCLLLSCFALSGASGLIYQTAWTQQFAFVFGTSELALVIVLAAYMAGLALGAAVAGKVEHRIRRPVLAYAVLELGIGLAALAVPQAVDFAGRFFVSITGGQLTLPDAASSGSALFYLVASFLILLLPTALMGATLPLLTRHVVRSAKETGRRVGALYTANTAGAAVGTLMTAFVMLPRLGLGMTIFYGVLINLLVCGLAILLARVVPVVEAETHRAKTLPGRSWILPVILVSGAVSFSYEVVWSRLLSFLVGGSIYAFATVLSTFLIGIALGAALASRLASTAHRARMGLVVTQISVAITGLFSIVAVDHLAGFAASAESGEKSLLRGALLGAVVLLPLTVAIGASFPFAVRILARDSVAAAAPASARILAWNTTGAIIGALSAGYFLLPTLGFAGIVKAAAVVSLVLAVVAALAETCRFRWLATIAGVCLLIVLVAPIPTPWQALRHSPMGGTVMQGEVVFSSVGRSATVLLFDQPQGWRLTTNGLPESVIGRPWDRAGRSSIARWMSLLPVALRPTTRSLLVVGLGAGITIEEVPKSVEHIDVVELEPEVVLANQYMAAHRRKDPLADPRLRIHINDARNALQLTGQQFDAIVSQPSHPWTAGSSHLFTREFFSVVHDRLTPAGVFVQWMGLQFVDDSLLRSLIATATDVFPYVEVYMPQPGGLLVVGSRESLDLEATAGEGLNAALGEWAMIGVLCREDIVAARRLDNAGAREFSAGAAVITDSRNLLRTGSPRVLRDPSARAGISRALAPFDPLTGSSRTDDLDVLYLVRRLLQERSVDRARALAETLTNLAEHHTAIGLIEMASGQRQRAIFSFNRALALDSNYEEALYALLLVDRAVGTEGGGALSILRRLQEDPVAAAVLEGWDRGDSWRGSAHFEKLFAGLDSRHPLFAEASRLRCKWRVASGDADHALEAMNLLQSLLVPPRPPDLLLFAQAAVVAGKPQVAFGVISERVKAFSGSHLERQALNVLRSLEGDVDEMSRQELLRKFD